jgi:uncharacterized membrane protein YfcA
MINAIVGAGSLLTFPTLLFLGYPPLVANVTNTVGIVPGTISGAIGYRRELAGQARRARPLHHGSSVADRCAPALILPAAAFAKIVPILILIACFLVAIQPRLSAWVLERRERAGVAHVGGGWTLVLGVYLTGIYGGYFGAAQGVILIALLAILVDDDLQRLNALKNLITVFINSVSAILFIFLSAGRLGTRDPAGDRFDRRRSAWRGRRPATLAVRPPRGDHHGRHRRGGAIAARLRGTGPTRKYSLTVANGRCMLVGCLARTFSFAARWPWHARSRWSPVQVPRLCRRRPPARLPHRPQRHRWT